MKKLPSLLVREMQGMRNHPTRWFPLRFVPSLLVAPNRELWWTSRKADGCLQPFPGVPSNPIQCLHSNSTRSQGAKEPRSHWLQKGTDCMFCFSSQHLVPQRLWEFGGAKWVALLLVSLQVKPPQEGTLKNTHASVPKTHLRGKPLDPNLHFPTALERLQSSAGSPQRALGCLPHLWPQPTFSPSLFPQNLRRKTEETCK